MINLLTFFIKDAYCYTQLIVSQVYVSISLLMYSHIPTAVISLFTGSFLLIKSRKLETKIFFFLTLVFFLFTLGDLTEWFVFLGRGTVIFARSIIELADPMLFILSSYFLFVLVKKKDVRFIYKIVWLLPITIYAGILIFSFSKNLITYNWDICEMVEANLVTVYGFYMDLFYLSSLIIFAIWSIIKGKGNRKEVSIASAGVCLFIILFFAMEYVFTGYIFGNAFDYNYFVYAFFGMPILILFLGYLIIKYNEFDVKLIAAQALVWALIALIGAQFFFITELVNLILNSVTFFAIVIFGRLLIKSVEKEIQQRERIEEIEKEVEKAYEVEKKANEELAALDKVKNQFLMQTQHDLRTPLTSIRGYCDLLLGGTFGKPSKKMKEVFERIEAVVTGKINDINNFLDVAQFQLGKGVVSLKSSIELLPILEEITNALAYKAESKGIYLKLEKPKKTFAISADKEKLKAAIFNIVDNAIKFTVKGGVSVAITKNQDTITQNENLQIIVKDTGIGIPQDKIKSMFETQFERTALAQKTATGSGVGLYLSGQIIKLHNGKVWAESEGEGKGSMFVIELPIS